MPVDYEGKDIHLGDRLVYGSNKGLRVGKVTKIVVHPGGTYWNGDPKIDTYSIQLELDRFGIGGLKKQTFVYDHEKMMVL